MSGEATVRAVMPTLRQPLGHGSTAPGAMLAGSMGGNLHEGPPSPPSLEGQYPVQENAPASIVHRLAQVALRQPLDVQIFNGDEVKFSDKPVDQFEVKILPLLGNLQVHLGNLPTHPSPTLRALLLPAKNSLFGSNLFLGFFKPSWVVPQSPIRKGQKVFHPHIYANAFAYWWQGLEKDAFRNF